MIDFKSLSLALAVVSTCFVAAEQSPIFASPLFPSESQHVAQQPDSFSTVMMVQISPAEVELKSDRSSELIGQLTVPLQLKGQTIPVGSFVRLAVVPTDNGDANLVADTIIIPSSGANISISAKGSIIPGTTITDRRSEDAGKEIAAIGSFLGERAGLVIGGDADDAIQSGSGGGLIGAGIGLLSSSKRQVVQLVQGVYILEVYQNSL